MEHGTSQLKRKIPKNNLFQFTQHFYRTGTEFKHKLTEEKILMNINDTKLFKQLNNAQASNQIPKAQVSYHSKTYQLPVVYLFHSHQTSTRNNCSRNLPAYHLLER